MKKLYSALLCAAAAFVLVACNGSSDVKNINLDSLDDTTEKCWQCTCKAGWYSEDTFMWGTEREVVFAMQHSEVVGVKWSYKEASAKTEEACMELDEHARN